MTRDSTRRPLVRFIPAVTSSASSRPAAAPLAVLFAALLAVLGAAGPAAAQTDYYNTDAGRPVQIEDAYALEYRGLELQAAPVRLERSRGGVYNFGVEPELAAGLFPRTQVAVGLPLAYVDAGVGRRAAGLAGVDVSVLHNLNAETTIPALAVAADVLLPAGGLGPARAYPSLKGIATKTFRFARFHVNGQYTFGRRLPAGDDVGVGAVGAGAQVQEVSRWLAGAAVDRTFPLRSLLVTGEGYARQPLRRGEPVEYTAAAGSRVQVTPRVALDGGVGRRLTGADQGWFVTFGSAYAFGLPWRR